jgi:hypothetical protein
MTIETHTRNLSRTHVSLGDIAPADYLGQVEQKYPGALGKQFVPTNQQLWRMDAFEDFLTGFAVKVGF